MLSILQVCSSRRNYLKDGRAFQELCLCIYKCGYLLLRLGAAPLAPLQPITGVVGDCLSYQKSRGPRVPIKLSVTGQVEVRPNSKNVWIPLKTGKGKRSGNLPILGTNLNSRLRSTCDLGTGVNNVFGSVESNGLCRGSVVSMNQLNEKGEKMGLVLGGPRSDNFNGFIYGLCVALVVRPSLFQTSYHLSPLEQDELSRIPDLEEIRQTLFSMRSLEAPGNDRMSVLFFKH
uniref:Uncharacterized protein n=1 Tax=Cannabis sativa TaxID=3483 RepID=A0A803QDB6_CANSA